MGKFSTPITILNEKKEISTSSANLISSPSKHQDRNEKKLMTSSVAVDGDSNQGIQRNDNEHKLYSLSVQDKTALEKENESLLQEFEGVGESLRQTATVLAQISEMQSVMETNVLSQAEQINHLHEEAILHTGIIIKIDSTWIFFLKILKFSIIVMNNVAYETKTCKKILNDYLSII